MELNGTERFEYKTAGPPTDKQIKIMERIERELGVMFKGENSRDAYEFISHYHKLIRD